MDPKRWEMIDKLVDAALLRPESERSQFVLENSKGDEDLARQTLALLEAHKGSDGFLETSAMKIVARSMADEETVFDQTLLTGKTLGTYKIEKVLGMGGMGEVYLAYDSNVRRKVALKILPAEYGSNDERVRRFELEARAVSRLNHPNIVTIFDVGNSDGLNYIATEYVEGETIREMILRKPKLREPLAAAVQVCDALAAAHGQGIIHRDIKPENIMIREDGYVKVLDFGLAKLTELSPDTLSDMAKTNKGVILGTPAYMSPEQVSDDLVDHRTDLWSIGVVLYEAVTGKHPFKGANRQETFQAILSHTPPPASELNPEVSEDFARLLDKALEKDPDLSYQTALDLRSDLKRIEREMDSSPSLTSRYSRGLTTVEDKPQKPKTRVFRVAGVLCLIFAGLTAAYFYAPWFTDQATDWSVGENSQLTENSGIEYFPSISPDGRSFVYSGDADGDFDIYWQRIGGKNPINITKDSAADDFHPAFSPDGEQIAFRSERESAGIYITGATGENTRRVSDFGFHPSWSPDGKELVVSTEHTELPNVRNSRPSSLWIISVETGAKRQVVEMDAMQPAWSPDGKWIAFWFMQTGGSKRDVGIVSSAGGEPIVVTVDGQTNWNPVWAPDGNHLYYASDRGGNMNFWRVPIDLSNGKPNGDPEAVVTPSKYSRHLAFSADGKKLIYVQSVFKSNIQAINFDVVSETTTGEPFWITTGDRQVSRPDLSADGKLFVSRTPRRTQDDIVVIDRQTGVMTYLTNDEPFDRFPRWSPDSKRIAFISDRTGSHEIWRINTDGTDLIQITSGNANGVTFPHWSPDGTKMLYRSDGNNYLFDPNQAWASHSPTMLSPPDNNAAFVVWDWSPDGKKLIGTFSDGIRGIGTYTFATRTYEKISDEREIPMWLPDSRRIAYAKDGKAHIFDTITRKEKPIALPQPDKITTVGVSRDGTLLYFTVLSNESDIWLLDANPEK